MKRFSSFLFILTFFCIGFSHAADSDFASKLEAFIEERYEEGSPGLSDGAFAEVITMAKSNPEQARKYFAMGIEVETQIPDDGSSRQTEGLRADMLLGKDLITEDARNKVLMQDYFVPVKVERNFSLDDKRRMWDAAVAAHKRKGGGAASLAIEHRLKDPDLHDDMMTIITESMIGDEQMGPVAKSAFAKFISSGDLISDANFNRFIGLAHRFTGTEGADDEWSSAMEFLVTPPSKDSIATRGERMEALVRLELADTSGLSVADYLPTKRQLQRWSTEEFERAWQKVLAIEQRRKDGEANLPDESDFLARKISMALSIPKFSASMERILQDPLFSEIAELKEVVTRGKFGWHKGQLEKTSTAFADRMADAKAMAKLIADNPGMIRHLYTDSLEKNAQGAARKILSSDREPGSGFPGKMSTDELKNHRKTFELYAPFLSDRALAAEVDKVYRLRLNKAEGVEAQYREGGSWESGAKLKNDEETGLPVLESYLSHGVPSVADIMNENLDAADPLDFNRLEPYMMPHDQSEWRHLKENTTSALAQAQEELDRGRVDLAEKTLAGVTDRHIPGTTHDKSALDQRLAKLSPRAHAGATTLQKLLKGNAARKKYKKEKAGREEAERKAEEGRVFNNKTFVSNALRRQLHRSKACRAPREELARLRAQAAARLPRPTPPAKAPTPPVVIPDAAPATIKKAISPVAPVVIKEADYSTRNTIGVIGASAVTIAALIAFWQQAQVVSLREKVAQRFGIPFDRVTPQLAAQELASAQENEWFSHDDKVQGKQEIRRLSTALMMRNVLGGLATLGGIGTAIAVAILHRQAAAAA